MKYLDLFSGYGGFSLGIQKAYEDYKLQQGQNWKENNISHQERPDIQQPETSIRKSTAVCIGFCEIDKYAIQVYQKHFKYEECEQCKKNREYLQWTEWGDIRPIGNQPDTSGRNDQQSETRRDREFQQPKNNCQCKHKNYGDITKIDPKELPDFDLLTGGFPCQAFSIAGKRGGFEDTRGTLIFDVFRILKEKQPRLVLLENVKGLLSHDSGRTFKTIITSLAELGYAVEWQVLNAKDFSVAQNRERVFIVGHLGGFGGRQVFPIREDDKENIESRQVCTTATVSTRTGSTAGGQQFIQQLNKPTHSNDRVYSEDGISPTLNTMQGGNRQPFVQRQPLKFLERNQKNIEGDYAFTVDTANTGGVRVQKCCDKCYTEIDIHSCECHLPKIRRLTPTECERLMGLPDGWTAEGTDGKISDTQRYKLCGNGVVVNVVEEIIKRLYDL